MSHFEEEVRTEADETHIDQTPVKFDYFTINDFELDELKRDGGMAHVQKATRIKTGDLVALKFNKDEANSQISSLSFDRESEALQLLRHQNIVHCYGVGNDGTNRFLVLEWLDTSLSDYIDTMGAMNWITFYEEIGRPVLIALTHAHKLDIAHRDLKPDNIMFDGSNNPKITDFGIARNAPSFELRVGGTLCDVGSYPWTPHLDQKVTPYELRDLYSWATICIACLTGSRSFDTTQSFLDSLDRLGDTAPSECLTRCLNIDPENSALHLLWSLEAFHLPRIDSVVRKVPITIASAVMRKLQSETDGLENHNAAVEYIARDFAESCQVSIRDKDIIELAGKTLNLQCRRFNDTSPMVSVERLFFDVRNLPSSISLRLKLTNARARSPGEQDAATDFIYDFLRRHRDSIEAQQRILEEERYLRMLIDVNGYQMRALNDLKPLDYRHGELNGRSFQVIIDGDISVAVGERFVVSTIRDKYAFTVHQSNSGILELKTDQAIRTKPPVEGRLLYDTWAQKVALRRQKAALMFISEDSCVMPSFKHYFLNPIKCDAPEQNGRPKTADLSYDKTEVLDTTLGTRQFQIIKGPPGTGKTTLIIAIIEQYLKENPGAKILLAAQTHIAVDNVIEKLLEQNVATDKISRIGRESDEKISARAKETLLETKLDAWCENVASQSRAYMKSRASKYNIDADEAEYYIRLCNLIQLLIQYEKVHDDLDQIDKEKLPADPNLTDIERETSLFYSKSELIANEKRLTNEIALSRASLSITGKGGSHLATCSREELEEWKDAFDQSNPQWEPFCREISVQVRWLDLLGQTKELREAVLRSSSIVGGTCVGLCGTTAIEKMNFDLCILDEASKATAAEALIPMVRSRRSVLVGDPKQLPPFIDMEIEIDDYPPEDIHKTLLDYFIEKLPETNVSELVCQHRMCQSIGDLVSEAFYNKKLDNIRPDNKRKPWISRAFSKPIVWVNIAGKQQIEAKSFFNLAEQREIVDILKRLDEAAVEDNITDNTVAVVAGYAAQARQLGKRVKQLALRQIKVEIATVDSFQGKDADICIYSVTLNNRDGFLGFLKKTERLNVAVSRARDLLIIVGNQEFCYRAEDQNPFRKIIEFIEDHPDTCETKHAG